MSNNYGYDNRNYGGWNNGYFYPPVNAAPYMYPTSSQYNPTPQNPQSQSLPNQNASQSSQPTATSPQFSFVSGVENAKNYLQLSQNAVLYDDDAAILYLKKTGADQKSEIKCFSLTEVEMPKAVTTADTSKYVLKEDFDKFASKIDNLINTFAPQFLGVDKPAKKQAEKQLDKGE